jgi:hypothetical protein
MFARRVLPRRIILVRHGESEGNVDESMYCRVPDPKISLTDTVRSLLVSPLPLPRGARVRCVFRSAERLTAPTHMLDAARRCARLARQWRCMALQCFALHFARGTSTVR